MTGATIVPEPPGAPPGAEDGIRHPWPDPPAPGQGLEVAPGILWLRLPLPMALDHVNVYALDDGPGWTLIDTGIDSARARALWSDILAGPLGGRPVTRVIVTHHHPDHVGLAGWFAENGAEVRMTRLAWVMARMLTLDAQDRPTPQALDLYRRAGMAADDLARRAAERPFNFADCVALLPPGFTRLEAGARIRIAARDWQVRLGGGHAPDHATLWEVGGDLVIGGDQLLPGISPHIGVHPNEPGADPLRDWFTACAALAPHARADHLVLPGHKLPFTGLPLRIAQLAGNHHGALDRLMLHLAQPRRAIDCFAPLFRRAVTEATLGLALSETLAHLNHLLRAGRVHRRDGPDGAWLWQAVEGSKA